jgi:hypothetical protein
VQSASSFSNSTYFNTTTKAVDLSKLPESQKVVIAFQKLKENGKSFLPCVQRELRLEKKSYYFLLYHTAIPDDRMQIRPLSDINPRSWFLYDQILKKFDPAEKSCVYMMQGSKIVMLTFFKNAYYIVRTKNKNKNFNFEDLLKAHKVSKYVTRYQQLQIRQHRPPLAGLHLGNNSYIVLSKFMGYNPIDFRNLDHLHKLLKLQEAFADECDVMDLNFGNLLIGNDANLYYVDQDLEWVKKSNRKQAREANFRETINFIKNSGFPEENELVEAASMIFSSLKA